MSVHVGVCMACLSPLVCILLHACTGAPLTFPPSHTAADALSLVAGGAAAVVMSSVAIAAVQLLVRPVIAVVVVVVAVVVAVAAAVGRSVGRLAAARVCVCASARAGAASHGKNLPNATRRIPSGYFQRFTR